jgi:hypothetical protein
VSRSLTESRPAQARQALAGDEGCGFAAVPAKARNLAHHLGVTVLAFDQPGAGETPVPLTVEADELVLGLVAEARRVGNGKVAHFGISFDANYSAMTGLLAAVNASIVLGGPIDHALAPDALRRLPYGLGTVSIACLLH